MSVNYKSRKINIFLKETSLGIVYLCDNSNLSFRGARSLWGTL